MIKILVVDDIEANRKLIRKILELTLKYQVIEANNGEKAVSQFKKEQPDLILMDIDMPVMDGYESANLIKALTGNNYVPIIFLTALSAETCLANALTSGGDDYLTKPLNVEILESKINAHLRIRELNQEINCQNSLLSVHNQSLSAEQELIEHFFESALAKSYLDNRFINYHMSSASAFNGDVLLVKRGPEGGLYVLIGDFTGHGLTAAMGTLPVAMIFFKMTSIGASIENIAAELNRQLHDIMPTSIFFAASLIEIDKRGELMSVWIGGMPENYWFSKEGELKSTIHAQHMPLGILTDDEFIADTQIFKIEKGDKLYLYSDGIIEAKNEMEEAFGEDRLKDILLSHKDNRLQKALSELKLFAGAGGQIDDITLVEITCDAIEAEESEHKAVATNEFNIPWNLMFSLTENEMRIDDPLKKIIDVLTAMPMLAKHKGALHILLSEMYANAIDHSILQLDSSKKLNEELFSEYYKEREGKLNSLQNSSIIFNYNFDPGVNPGQLEIKMEDNGIGYQQHAEINSNEILHGRGLDIIYGCCDKVTFSENGKVLTVIYKLS